MGQLRDSRGRWIEGPPGGTPRDPRGRFINRPIFKTSHPVLDVSAAELQVALRGMSGTETVEVTGSSPYVVTFTTEDKIEVQHILADPVTVEDIAALQDGHRVLLLGEEYSHQNGVWVVDDWFTARRSGPDRVLKLLLGCSIIWLLLAFIFAVMRSY